MFSCKCCPEKERYIQDLKGQIAFLQTLLTPVNNPEHVPAIAYEADSVLSGSQAQIVLDPIAADENRKQKEEEAEILAERDRILSGQY